MFFRKMKSLVTIFLLTVFAFSCTKIESLSEIPFIEYRSFQIFDTIDPLGNQVKGGRLTFYFEDGDGDIGIPPNEQSDSNNLFVTLLRKVDGQIVLAPEDDPLRTLSYRIPYIENEGNFKILKGLISVSILYPYYTQSDTIKYEFYIIDRATHESNTAQTNEIIVSENGNY